MHSELYSIGNLELEIEPRTRALNLLVITICRHSFKIMISREVIRDGEASST
ncbi:MAG: hypothetical protein ACLTZT_00315 [Butyricimonas faecalis]